MSPFIFICLIGHFVMGPMACPPLQPTVDPNGLVMNGPAGYCFYVYWKNVVRGISYETATQMCQQLSPAPYRWYLPKLGTRAKLVNVETILDSAVSHDWWWFWLGLRRDPATPQEAINLGQWADPSKWRWSGDNSTLDTSFVNEVVPWDQNQPDNSVFVVTQDEQYMESCVTVHYTPTVSQLKWPWNDRPCEPHGHVDNDTLIRIPMVVCETGMRYGQGTTIDVTLKSNTPFQWQWVLLGIALFACFVSVLFVGCVCYRKKRRMPSRRSNSTGSGRGGGRKPLRMIGESTSGRRKPSPHMRSRSSSGSAGDG